MAGETSVRQWWLICRRDGHIIARIKLPVVLLREQMDLDALVGPLQYTKDFEFVDYESILPSDDQVFFINYETVATTYNWEIDLVE